MVAGACLAESGNDVVCVDRDDEKVRKLRRGKMPFYEPGLEELVRRNRAEGRLTFASTLPKAVRAASVIFIAVGTPQGEDGSADVNQVLTVASDIARSMNGYKVIVDKSTVPVSADRVREVIRRETTHPFSVVSNPEFLKQGAAVEDFMKPDRVVIGAEDPRAEELMREVYSPFTRTGAPIMVMDCGSAELSKCGECHARDAHFVHERDRQRHELVGADIDQVRRAVGSDRRIGPSFLFPGIGYGGSCFPKTSRHSFGLPREKEYDIRILQAVEAVNACQKTRLLSKMRAHFGNIKGKTVAVWGCRSSPGPTTCAKLHRSRSSRSLARCRKGAGVTPGSDPGGKENLRQPGDVCVRQLRGAQGCGLPGHCDGMERVPAAGFRANAEADARTGGLRRRNLYTPNR